MSALLIKRFYRRRIYVLFKKMSKIVLIQLILTTFYVGCGGMDLPLDDQELFDEDGFWIDGKGDRISPYWIEVKPMTIIKRPDANGKVRMFNNHWVLGEDYCRLNQSSNKNIKYYLYSRPRAVDSHYLVNIIDFTKKGCGFSKGHVFSGHVTRTSNSYSGSSGGGGSYSGGILSRPQVENIFRKVGLPTTYNFIRTIYWESGFNPRAKGCNNSSCSNYDLGLMQINKANFSACYAVGATNLYDPYQNALCAKKVVYDVIGLKGWYGWVDGHYRRVQCDAYKCWKTY